jgi:hypothetical protein
MPRPKAHPDQHLRAYRLWRGGKGQTDIWNTLAEGFDDPVSERTVGTWVRGFKDLSPETIDLDSPFEWHRLESYGLPWEAGGYVLELWRLNVEGNLIAYEIILADGAIRTPQSGPTIRQAHWWWRIHQAIPDLGFSEVNILADNFVLRELNRDVLAIPMELADLQAFIAYRPWEGLPGDSTKYEGYREAISQGRILPLTGGADVKSGDFIADIKRVHPQWQKILELYDCNPAFFFLENGRNPTASPIKGRVTGKATQGQG